MDLLAVRPKSVRDALHHGILRVVTHHRPPLFGQHAGPGRHRHARHAHRPHREAHSGAKEASKRRFRQKIFSLEQRHAGAPAHVRHLLGSARRVRSACASHRHAACARDGRAAPGSVFRDEVRGPVDVRVPTRSSAFPTPSRRRPVRFGVRVARAGIARLARGPRPRRADALRVGIEGYRVRRARAASRKRVVRRCVARRSAPSPDGSPPRDARRVACAADVRRPRPRGARKPRTTTGV